MQASSLKKTDYYLLISFFSLAVPLILFIFRFLDDNKLTSWQWIFSNTNAAQFFLILVLSVGCAYLLSKTAIFENSPLFLFFASFLVSILFWGEPEVIIDAARYFTQAKQLATHGTKYFFSEWGRDVFAWTDLPLVPFCYGLIFKYLGESRIYIQLFTSFLFAATVVLTYLLGRILWDEEIGFYGGLLLLGIPYLFVQVPLMLVDVPTMFFLMLAIYTFIKAIKNGGWETMVFSALALFFAVLAKFSTWVFLSGLAVILLVGLRTEFRKSLKRGSITALLFLLFAAIMFSLKYEVIVEQIRFLVSYQKPGLARWGESYISTFFFQTHVFLSVSALCSAIIAFKKRDYNYLIISCFFILIFLIQAKRARYTLPIFPMLALMASYGLREIRSGEIRRFVVFCAVSTSIAIAFFSYLPFLQKMSAMNIKNAGEFLNTIDVDHIEIIALSQEKKIVNPVVSVPLIDLYAKKDIRYRQYTHPLPPKGFLESPLRFTWEYKTPEFYDPDRKVSEKEAVVVVFGQPDQTFPSQIEERIQNFRRAASFEETTGLFLYNTLVRVYY